VGQDALKRTLKLQPSELILALASDPPGAEIFINGKSVDLVTPANVKVAPDVQKVELRKKCYDVAEVALDEQVDLSKAIVKKLVKLPSCR
jgi:hypothetical protein